MNANIIGKGAYGTVYEHGPHALKVTCEEREYKAALELMKSPRPWACTIYSAEQKSENEFHIVKERVTPFLSGEYNNRFPGHFHGIKYQEGEYKGIATRPVEFNGFPFDYNDNKPMHIIELDKGQLNFLTGLYKNDAAQQRCFTWFVTMFWQAKRDNFFTADLWNNIGVRDNGEFVIFDVMSG